MPTFDVVSEVNQHEITNALDQAGKEVTTRFDLKDSGTRFERAEDVITLVSDSDFHLDQALQVLLGKLAKRQVDLRSLEHGKLVTSGKEVRQTLTIRQGIDADLGRKIVKLVKEAKLKTQASIQDDKVRINGKKRDDLQAVIALLTEAKLDQPLQFNNFRD